MTAIVTGSSGKYVLHLGKDERALLGRLLGELRELVTDPVESSALRRRRSYARTSANVIRCADRSTEERRRKE